jgi:hypothetical protein
MAASACDSEGTGVRVGVGVGGVCGGLGVGVTEPVGITDPVGSAVAVAGPVATGPRRTPATGEAENEQHGHKDRDGTGHVGYRVAKLHRGPACTAVER